MHGMSMPEISSASRLLMQQSSGTAMNPASAPMSMIMLRAGSWSLMFHGLAFLTDIQQTGPRGGDKFVSTNWFMGMAEHSFGRGSLMMRTMLSLDPATVTQRRYPELFQTGETAFGRPIVDGQHPHDLFMELSLQYAVKLTEKTSFNLYLAPVGDPALGPVAFPHRISATEIPQAALAHHLQDSTHIANDVLTIGVTRGMWRLEASGFHGAEPNENRWNIDQGALNSWSTRLAVAPTSNWSGQVSVGRVKRPEALENLDVVRSTASITYYKPLSAGSWAASLVWGRNHKTVQQQDTNSYLAESVFQFHKQNYLTGRVELLDKDELFEDQPEIKEHLEKTAGSVFRVSAYTIGYTRDIKFFPGVQTGIGWNVSWFKIPSALQPFYGDHPVAFCVFMRFRLKQDAPVSHGH